jgi:hypothetical protein
VDVETLGVGDPVTDVLAEGLADRDVLDDGEALGDELGLCVGLALGEALGDCELATQVGVTTRGELDAPPVDPGVPL